MHRAKGIFIFVVLMLALAFPARAGDGARAPRIVGIDVHGQPEELFIPHGVLPPIPILYSHHTVTRAGYALSRFFAESGYPYSHITVSIVREGPGEVILRFDVDPDDRVCFGPSYLLGVDGKRSGMFLRDVRFDAGQVYNSAAVDESVRRLAFRPYVHSATAMSPVVIDDAPPPCGGGADVDVAGACCGDSAVIAVVPINVVEKYGMELEGAVGYESGRDGAKGRFSGRLNVSLINMLRWGEGLDIFYFGTNTVQKMKLAGSVPWVFGLPLELGGAAGMEVEDEGYGHFNGELWGAVEAGGWWRVGAAVKGSETVPPDTLGPRYHFYGADIFLSLMRRPWERGQTVWEFDVRTGSGVANREKSYARSTAELSGGVHWPVFANYALASRVSARSLFTDEEYLPPVELYRTGGYGSLRGYSEDEFAFRTVVFARNEALYYFNQEGAVFVFVDGGAGFVQPGALSLSSAQRMLGYGLGLRFPSGAGAMSVEWGRNIDDGSSLGRVHVGIRMSLQ